MKRHLYIFLILEAILLFSISPVLSDELTTTTWGGNAEMAYDTGFMHMLKKHPG